MHFALENVVYYTDEQIRQKVNTLCADVVQKDLAEDLGVTSSAISRALNHQGPRWRKLRIRILEALGPYKVDPEPRFHVERIED